MKWLFSLAALIVGSLTLCGAAAHGETWRLTNDAFSDSLPKITIDNSKNVWVAWLSRNNGWLNPAYKVFNGSAWSATQWIDFDAVSQSTLNIVNDSYHGTVWAAWDSASHLLVAQNKAGVWSTRKWVNDSSSSLQCLSIVLYADNIGNVGVGWAEHPNPFHAFTRLREYCDTTWVNMKTVFEWNGESEFTSYSNSLTDIAVRTGFHPNILYRLGYGGGAKWFWGNGLDFSYWGNDSAWHVRQVEAEGGGGMSMPWGVPSVGLGITSTRGDTLLVCYNSDSSNMVAYGTKGVICKRYVSDSCILDKIYPYLYETWAHSGSLCGLPKPCFAWSDTHSIYLKAYYDTIWSRPAVRITDTTLHNCINPDIVAENDSTVWVCYQNDGDIYVTRTSVPLGVTGNPNIEHRISKPISLKAWPNPALNVIHFSYALPAKQNSSVSIYDIAGRLVKTMEISENQTDWNCVDNIGRKVASGVYFARLKSDGQETIQRISIIK